MNSRIPHHKVPRTSIISEWSIYYGSLSAMFTQIHSSTNQHLSEKYRQILSTQRKLSRATTKLTPFTVSKDEWNTKEDTGKSLKNTLHVLWYAKRHLSHLSDIEQWKNQATSLSRYELHCIS